jgi:hypothetical protein
MKVRGGNRSFEFIVSNQGTLTYTDKKNLKRQLQLRNKTGHSVSVRLSRRKMILVTIK